MVREGERFGPPPSDVSRRPVYDAIRSVNTRQDRAKRLYDQIGTARNWMNEQLSSKELSGVPERDDFRTRLNNLPDLESVNNTYRQTSQDSNRWFNRSTSRDTRQGAEKELRRIASESAARAVELLEIMGKHGNKDAQIAYERIHGREKQAKETFDWVMQKPLKGSIDRLEIQEYCQESFAGFRNALIPAVVDYTQVAQGKGSAFDRLDRWLSHLQDSRARFMGIWGRRPWLEGELLAPGGKEPVFFKDQKLPSGETKEPGQREIPNATRNAARSPEQTKSPREITTRTSLEGLLRDSPPKPPEADLRGSRLPNKDTSNYWRKEGSHPNAEEAHADQLRTLLYRKFGDEIVQSDLLKEQGTSKMDTKVTKIQDGNPAVYRENDGTYFVTYDKNNAKKIFGANEDLSKRHVQLDDALLQKLERNEATVTWDLPKVFRIPLEKPEGETHVLITDDEKHAQDLIQEQHRDGRVFDFSTTRKPDNERRTSQSLDPIPSHTKDYPTSQREAPTNARERSRRFAFGSDQATRPEATTEAPQRTERRPTRSSVSEARHSALNHNLSRPPHRGEWPGLLGDEQSLRQSKPTKSGSKKHKPTNKAWKHSMRSILTSSFNSVIDTLSLFS